MRSVYILIVSIVAIALAPDSPIRAQGIGSRSVSERRAAVITSARAREHLGYIAADRMMGRNTPSPELESAGNYIADHFRAYGLEPVAGSWFQTYYLTRSDLAEPTSLTINGRPFPLKQAFIPIETTGSGAAAGGMAFVGYGVSRADSSYDDYRGIDVRGRIVLAMTGNPLTDDPRANRTESSTRNKMLLAASHGAVGLLLISNPNSSHFLLPNGYPWSALYPKAMSRPPLLHEPPLPAGAIPSAGISGDVAREMFGGDLRAFITAADVIDSLRHPQSMLLPARAELRIAIHRDSTPVRNVAGMLRGSTHPDEFVVVGAHYDHIGHGQGPGKRKGADTIYNGADDNGSGTTAVLLLAEAYGGLPPGERPARSILFLAFSGEEEGLLGSHAYMAAPLVPVDKMVGMINMDMIGRNARDSISVAGRSRSPEMTAFAEAANRAEPMKLAYDLEEMFYRSDQASFAEARIPVLFFSSGLHADYHAVTDSPEKIDYVKLAHVTRLCFRTLWLIAESPTRPAFHEQVGE
ncbi:MAG: M28 family peptidase [Candidatus Kapaibacterium sp.]